MGSIELSLACDVCADADPLALLVARVGCYELGF